MHLKKLGIALLAIAALSAIVAGSASAAATTTAKQWYTGSSPGTTLAGSTGLALKLKTGTTAKLETKLGKNLTPVTLNATGASCSSCTIENKEVTSKTGKVAYGSGKVLFTGVTVSTPANCKVISEAGVTGQVITKALVAHADFMNGTTAVQQFIPAAGASTSFATFELENNGGTCAVAGLYSVTGSLFSDATNPTETFAKEQGANINPTIETNDGGGLFIGSQPANLYAEGVFSLTSGAEFAIK